MAGIYLHIPFCKQACHYCDFHFSTSLKKKEPLVEALVQELILRKAELKNEPVETIYFGGGTPSLLSMQELQHLMDTIYHHFEVTGSPEITIEANPDDLTSEKITNLSKSPINRLSIGVQSFFEEDLIMMNRAHNATEAKRCLELATQHFSNITVDLIYGIPTMSIERWKYNFQTVFDFNIPHISSYALTVEPKTALDTFIKKGTYPTVDETLAKEHFDILISESKAHGFVPYEISNFGKPGFFSKHNTAYWQGKPYLGIGPSAHSFDGETRSWNISNNSKYIAEMQQGHLPSQSETLSVQDQFNEYIMTGLRTIWGVSLEKIVSQFGEVYKQHLLQESQKFIEAGLLQVTSAETHDYQGATPTLVLTEKGKFLADGIASDLFFLN